MKTKPIVKLLSLVLPAALLAASFLLPQRALAGGGAIMITTTADNTTTNGLCSLREAIFNTNNNTSTYADCAAGAISNDTLMFDISLGTATITLTSNLPVIATGNLVTIDGESRTTISGNGLYQIFRVQSAATLNLKNLTITRGHTAASGGALSNDGTTNISRVTFSKNSATGNGGAVSNGHIMTVAGSTFTGNTAGADGGALSNFSSNAQVTISNSTFANNSANYGGGLINNSGMANILSSTFSGNTSNASNTTGGAISTWNGTAGFEPATYIFNSILANSPSGADCNNVVSGTLVGSNNIIESTSSCAGIASITSDPRLTALKGKPAYFYLLDGSPAINAGHDDTCAGPPVSGSSQNGVPRPQGLHCDIGSVETSVKRVFRSAATYDGSILESTPTSSVGGSLDASAATLRVGDDALRRQYRSILSFNTASVPDNAILTGVKLKVKLENTAGTGNPVTLLGGFRVDIKTGIFGTAPLQITDFQAAAAKTFGPFSPTPVSRWYTINLPYAKAYMNIFEVSGGLTQIRLRFTNADNGNSLANYLSLYSGNAVLADRPQLVVYYYIP